MSSSGDISDASHGERFHHYLDEYGGVGDDKTQYRIDAFELAWQSATSEMLDEIHLMLRQLLAAQDGEGGGDGGC